MYPPVVHARRGGRGRKQQAILGRGRWDADALRDTVRDYVVEHFADVDAMLVIDEANFLEQKKRRAAWIGSIWVQLAKSSIARLASSLIRSLVMVTPSSTVPCICLRAGRRTRIGSPRCTLRRKRRSR